MIKFFWGGNFWYWNKTNLFWLIFCRNRRFACRFDTPTVLERTGHNSDRYRFLLGKYMISIFSMPLPYIIYFNKYYHFHFALKGLQLLLCTCFMHYLMLLIGLLRAFVCSSTHACNHCAGAASWPVCNYSFFLSQ